jgi:hypothetical protein
MGCEEIGSEQDGLEIERSIEKRRWKFQNQEIVVVNGLNFIAEHKKAEPDIISTKLS